MIATTSPILDADEIAMGRTMLGHARMILRETIALCAAFAVGSGFWVTLALYIVFAIAMYFVDKHLFTKVEEAVPLATVGKIGASGIKTVGFLCGLFSKRAPAAA